MPRKPLLVKRFSLYNKKVDIRFNKTKAAGFVMILLAFSVFQFADPHYWYQCESFWKLILYNISDWILLASPLLIIIGAIFLFKGWPWWLIILGFKCGDQAYCVKNP